MVAINLVDIITRNLEFYGVLLENSKQLGFVSRDNDLSDSSISPDYRITGSYGEVMGFLKAVNTQLPQNWEYSVREEDGRFIAIRYNGCIITEQDQIDTLLEKSQNKFRNPRINVLKRLKKRFIRDKSRE